MREVIAEALRVLEVDQLVCAVHDRCLPSQPEEDIGCGAPDGRGAEHFLGFLSELGFTGMQLGPAGQISPGNVSPYDGTVFSRSVLNLAWQPIIEGRHGASLLPPESVEALGAVTSSRCDYPRAFATQGRLLGQLHACWDEHVRSGSADGRELSRRLSAFMRAADDWLFRDGLYAALSEEYRHAEPGAWPNRLDAGLFSRDVDELTRQDRLQTLSARYATSLDRYAREQMLLAEQHQAFRRKAASQGLAIFADLQVGLSLGDRWAWAKLMLDGYAMGAPPSRTNPEGQPWGYPVLDPAQAGERGRPGPGLQCQQYRFRKLFAEYDGMRLDHPHGLVCPWLYRIGGGDPYRAVQQGARLYSVGPGSTHETLARFDIARPEQLAVGQLDPWADGWVTELDEEQVARYARWFDLLMEDATAAGVHHQHVLCEVLSTEPYALARVRERHGLGRFRVTAKADVDRSDDVYLPSNAQPHDWVMVGTHDTPPLWHTVQCWNEETIAARAGYAASQLAPDGVGRDVLMSHFSGSRDALALAEFALLFTSRARNIMIFVGDLLGERQIYNRPGLVHPDNWLWRVDADFRATYASRLGRGAALDLPAVLALAIAALAADDRRHRAPLVRGLLRAARVPLPEVALRLRGVANG